MRIEYVGHAGVVIETADARIGMDPWLHGSAYCDSWHIFPKPVDTAAFDRCDHLVLTHGHEDHMHVPTLSRLPKEAEVWLPYSWYGGTAPFLNEIGYQTVHEVTSFKTRELGPDTRLTFVSNNLDNIVVVESAGRVVVNVNDALHSAHHSIIDMFVNAIKQRWPRIDTVLCGFGGASYFPNMVHAPGKDDREVGRLREQLFAHNFCRIVEGLEPSEAIPFAADFALLDPANRWIAQIRFPREKLPEYFRTHFPEASSSVIVMYPGDLLIDGDLKTESPYREELTADGLDHLIDVQYHEDIERKENPVSVAAETGDQILTALTDVVSQRKERFDAERLAQLRLCVEVTDLDNMPCFQLDVTGEASRVERRSSPLWNTNVHIKVPAAILMAGLESEWGGEAITIGYGAEVHILEEHLVPEKLDSMAIDLITQLPSAARHARKEPVRAMRYMLGNPLSMKWAAERFLKRSKPTSVFDQSFWLTRSKCDICQMCDMPLLDDGTLASSKADPAMVAVLGSASAQAPMKQERVSRAA